MLETELKKLATAIPELNENITALTAAILSHTAAMTAPVGTVHHMPDADDDDFDDDEPDTTEADLEKAAADKKLKARKAKAAAAAAAKAKAEAEAADDDDDDYDDDDDDFDDDEPDAPITSDNVKKLAKELVDKKIKTRGQIKKLIVSTGVNRITDMDQKGLNSAYKAMMTAFKNK